MRAPKPIVIFFVKIGIKYGIAFTALSALKENAEYVEKYPFLVVCGAVLVGEGGFVVVVACVALLVKDLRAVGSRGDKKLPSYNRRI